MKKILLFSCVFALASTVIAQQLKTNGNLPLANQLKEASHEVYRRKNEGGGGSLRGGEVAKNAPLGAPLLYYKTPARGFVRILKGNRLNL